MLASFKLYLLNAPLSKKINLTIVPPMVLVLAVVLLIITQNVEKIRAASITEDVIELVLILDGVAHQHAVERGLTAGFLASKGQVGKRKLVEQRKRADTAAAAFKKALTADFTLTLGEDLQEHLRDLGSELASVASLREEVDQLDTSSKPFARYSEINKAALDGIDELSALIGESSVLKGLHSLTGLLWLKERSGQERGALNGIFASGQYTTAKLLSVSQYINEQNDQLDFISRNMPAQDFSVLVEGMASDANTEVLAIRQQFFEAIEGRADIPRNSQHWFAVSTERIKHIKAVADALSENLSLAAAAKARNALITLVALVLVTVLICWSIFSLSQMVSRQIRTRVGELTSMLNAVAQCKDFNSRLNASYQDELGQAANAFNALLEELQLAIHAATDTVSAVASGKFDARISQHFDGDLKHLKDGVNQSSEKVEKTMSALADVMSALARGDFSARMDSQVEGGFKQKVDGAMQATESAINAVSSVISAMSAGDFSARIQVELPGKLNELKYSVNTSLENISSAMDDINQCVQAQKKAEFSWRISSDYSGDLQVLKNGINDSMQSIDEAIKDLNRIFRHIKRGDYTLRIEREMSGDLAEMKLGINTSLNELDSAVSEIVSVAAAQQKGLLDVRIEGQYQGQLAELKTSLNGSGQALNITLSLISDLMLKMKNGDFSGRIDQAMDGVFNELKNAVNESLIALQHAVSDLTRIASAQKKGELFKRMEDSHRGELANISSAVNESMHNLGDIVQKVQQSSTHTLAMTGEQSTATFEMSKRTEGQAAALEEIAASMEEIAAATDHAEKRCSAISLQVNKAMQVGEQSLATVESTVESMALMRESSQKIASITSMIDEISFQTNLLALNAAVEAARAGEQGRGFAVVASEVRNLAQRSSEAARSIKELIEENVTKVDSAWELSQKSKDNLKHIAQMLSDSHQLTIEVSAAASEQNQGVQEVNAAISSLDAMTQENAAMVEETKAATKNVEEQSASMHKLLGFFSLADKVS